MKKLTSLLLAAALCLTLAACGQTNRPSPSPSGDVPATGSAEPSAQPSVEPTVEPEPSVEPTVEPEPSVEPTVTPSQEEPTLTLSHTDVTVREAGYTFTIAHTLSGFFGASSAALVWSSSDERVATVDNGRVTCLAPGQATITAETYLGISASCIVRCSWSEETPAPSPSVDLAAFAQQVRDAYVFGARFTDENTGETGDSMTLLDPADEFGAALLANYFPGLTDLALKQRVVCFNNFSFNNCELTLVEAASAADAAKAAAILQARIDYMVGDGNGPGGAWYPEPTAVWENCSQVVTHGNFVMLVVHETNHQDIVDLFNALF